jgi:hypothetical protein
MWFFIALAILGLVASAVAHSSTFFGVDPQAAFPPVFLLHIGIFLVWIPAVVSQVSRTSVTDARPRRFDVAFPHAPHWMKLLTGLLFAYGIVNFLLFLFLITGSEAPRREPDGTFTANKGQRVITKAAYHRLRALEVRGFSGHWMLFYAAGMTILTSERRRAAALAAPGASIVTGR